MFFCHALVPLRCPNLIVPASTSHLSWVIQQVLSKRNSMDVIVVHGIFLHKVCKLDCSTYPGPHSMWQGPSHKCLSSCDRRFLVRFLFLFWSSHIPWLMTLWQRRWIIQHQGAWHEYALWDKFLSATRHKLDSYSSWSIISTNLSATIFAMKHACQTCKTSWVIW